MSGLVIWTGFVSFPFLFNYILTVSGMADSVKRYSTRLSKRLAEEAEDREEKPKRVTKKKKTNSKPPQYTDHTKIIFDVFNTIKSLHNDNIGDCLAAIATSMLKPCASPFIKDDNKSKIDLDKLVKFCQKVTDHMRVNQYHSSTHVIDVVQSTHALWLRANLSEIFSEEDHFAAIVAALIHDLDHMGLSNDYLKATQHEWAKQSGEEAPNEYHHLQAGLTLLEEEPLCFITGFSQKAKTRLKKKLTDLVLATDMNRHAETVTGLEQDVKNAISNGEKLTEKHKKIILQGLIKTADLGHLYAPWSVHRQWVYLLEEELFSEGDKMRENKMTVPIFKDRKKPGVSSDQEGFFNNVAFPLFEAWTNCFPECAVIVEQAKSNLKSWKTNKS
eukprot:m.125888 g.125888  ORF g.125888 m.125888 type:complete len:387 (+) comp14503_c0_seq2:202-1362(+)